MQLEQAHAYTVKMVLRLHEALERLSNVKEYRCCLEPILLQVYEPVKEYQQASASGLTALYLLAQDASGLALLGPLLHSTDYSHLHGAFLGIS